MVHAVIRQHYRQTLQRVALGCGDFTGLLHAVKHHVAPVLCALRVTEGIVKRRVVAHAHKHGRLLNVEVTRVFAEVHISRCLNAHGVVQEVKLVEIHLDDFVLGVVALQLHGYHPLYGFLQRAFKYVARLRRIELLGELLRDCAAAAGAFLPHEHTLHHGSHQSPAVYSGVALKSLVLGRYERVGQIFRHLVKIHIHAVALAAVVTPHFHTVGRKHRCGKLVGRVFELLDWGHIAYYTIVYQHKKHHAKCYKYAETFPHIFHHFCIMRSLLGVALSVLLSVHLLLCFSESCPEYSS